MKIVGIAACPIGIAHTYMAAENMEKICKENDIECKMETQGAMGAENELEDVEIEEADFVLLTVGVEIEGRERFEDKIVYEADVSEAVQHPEKVLKDALQYYESEK